MSVCSKESNYTCVSNMVVMHEVFKAHKLVIVNVPHFTSKVDNTCELGETNSQSL